MKTILQSFETLVVLTLLTVIFSFSGNAQSTDDYRTINSGNWNSLAIWERYDGADWLAAATLPSSSVGVITIQTGHNVTISDNRLIDQTIVESGATLTHSGGNLTINDGTGDDLFVSGTMLRSGGTLLGTGNVEVEGSFTWQAGTMNGSVVVNVLVDATLTLNGTGAKNFGGSAEINLHGTGTWSAGSLTSNSGTQRLNIFGTLDITAAVSTNWNVTSSTSEIVVKPTGVLNKTNGTTNIVQYSFRFINEGTVNVNSGTLSVATNATLSGELYVEEGATYSYSTSTATYNSGTNFSGLGLKTTISGTTTIAQDVTVSGGTYRLAGGTLNGSAVMTVESGATFNFQGGTFNGTATVDVEDGAELLIDGTSSKNFGGSAELNHYGSGTWSAGSLTSNSGTQRLNIFGTLDITAAVSTNWNVTSSTSEIVVKPTGVLNKTNGTTNIVQYSFRFINEGTVNVNSGTLSVATNATHSGELFVEEGATYSYTTSTATYNSGTNFSGPGLKTTIGGTTTIAQNVTVSGGTYRHAGGTLNGSAVLTVESGATFNFQGGTFNGTATVDVEDGAELLIDGTSSKNFGGSAELNHYGTGTWSAGSLTSNSGTQRLNIFGTFDITAAVSTNWNVTSSTSEIVVKPTGVLNKTNGTTNIVQYSFRFINEGTVNVNSGTLSVATNATLSGELFVDEGATYSYSTSSATYNSGTNFSGPGLKTTISGTTTIAQDVTVSGGTYRLAGGTLNGSAVMTVENGAIFNFQSGTFNGTATVDIEDGSELLFNGTGIKNFGGSAELNLHGTGTWNAGTIRSNSGAQRFNIFGTFAVNGAVSTDWASTASTSEIVVKPTGTLNKSEGTTSIPLYSFRFINEGTVNVNSGTLSVNTQSTHSGELFVETGALFNHSTSTATSNAGSTYSGGGIKSFDGGTLTIAGESNVTGGSFRLNGGTMNGTDTLWIQNGAIFNFSSGTLNGSAVVEIDENSQILFTTASNKSLGNTTKINHRGSGEWNGGVVRASSGSQQINIYGVLDVTASVSTNWVSSGTNQIVIRPLGELKLVSGSLNIASTTFALINEGKITGTGTLSINNGFTNSGNIEPGVSIGILTMTGAQPLSANSTVVIQLQNGSGPGTGHDQLTRNANMTLAGTLTVTETGTVPNGTYTIINLTSGSISGSFTTINLPLYYTLQVNSNNVQVIRDAPPCFDEFYSFDVNTCGAYTWNDITYTMSGSYEQVFITNLGCDSTVTLNLTLEPCGLTQLNDVSCGATNVTMESTLRALNVNAPEYRFKITGPNNGGPGWDNDVFILDRPNRAMKFQFVPGSLWGETYSIEVASGNGFGNFGDYGAACNVSLVGAIPTGSIQTSDCNATVLSTVNVTANNVIGAAAYRFRIIGTNNANWIDDTFILEKTIRKFKFTEAPGSLWGSTYTVEVAIQDAAGNWGSYGAPCNITVAVPSSQLQESHCGLTNVSPSQTLSANKITGATGYRFRISGPNTTNWSNDEFILDRPNRNMTFAMISGFMPGEEYTVEVALKDVFDNYTSYGPICTITLEGAPDFVINDQTEALENNQLKTSLLESTADVFSIHANCNPFNSSFVLSLNNSNDYEDVNVLIFDSKGSLVENHQFNPIDAQEIHLGQHLVSGLYIIQVVQGNNFANLRQIKE